jgi:hypothetical protein
MTREWFNSYIELYYVKGFNMNQEFHGFDHLFTEDYERSSTTAEGIGVEEVTRLRSNAKRFYEYSNPNPSNVNLTCDAFIIIMIRINKFSQKVRSH